MSRFLAPLLRQPDLLIVGDVPAHIDLKNADAVVVGSSAEAEAITDGTVVRRFDYISYITSSTIRPSVIKPLRALSDPLADAVVDFLDLKPGQDALTTIQDELGTDNAPDFLRHFWDQVTSFPPEGVTALSKDGTAPSLVEGQEVFWKYAAQIFTALMHFSLAGGFSSPNLSAVMNETGYLTSAYTDATYKRLLETTLFVLDAMRDMRPGEGRGWRSCVRVRLLHAQVRRRIRLKQGKLKTYDVGVSGIPINQADLCTVLGSFMIAPLWSMKRTGIHLTPREIASYQAAWRHIGYYMGVDSQFLRQFYGSTFAHAESAFASLAFENFPEQRPANGIATPTYRILASVAGRPPRPKSTIGYHCEYSRKLLGSRLAEQLAIPRGTWKDSFDIEKDIWFSWALVTFGRLWRRGWEKDRRDLFAHIIELLVVWQLGERRSVFAWREEKKWADKFTDSEGEDPGIKLGKEVGKDVRRRWMLLMVEMVAVCVGAAGIVALSALVAFTYMFK